MEGQVRILPDCYILKYEFLPKKLQMFFVCFDVGITKISIWHRLKSLREKIRKVGKQYIYIEKYFEIQSGSRGHIRDNWKNAH